MRSGRYAPTTPARPGSAIILRMKRLLALSIGLALAFGAAIPLEAQRRGGPPRRLTDPSDFVLPGKSRVEFRTFFAESVGKQMSYSIFLPPSYQESGRNYPVVYFLHGMFNDHTSWCVDRYGNLPSQIEAMMLEGRTPEFLIVHPDGESSFYTDSVDGRRRYEQYVTGDVIEEVERHYRVKPGRENRTMGGTSMGGYGALKAGLKHPGLFSAVLAGSPIILSADDPLEALSGASSRSAEFFAQIFGQIYGDPIDREHWKQNSLLHLAEAAQVGDLRIKILYGTADRYNGLVPMEVGIRALERKLKMRGADISLEIYPGEGHGWSLVADHLDEAVAFLSAGF